MFGEVIRSRYGWEDVFFGKFVGNDPDTMSQWVQVACNNLYGKRNFLVNQIGACRSHLMYLFFKITF